MHELVRSSAWLSQPAAPPPRPVHHSQSRSTALLSVHPLPCLYLSLKDNSLDDATNCVKCLKDSPLKDKPKLSYLANAYMTACAKCYKMSGGAREQCLQCISTWDAKPWYNNGTLSRDELMQPGTSTTRPNPRVNDFGACVWAANNTQSVQSGIFTSLSGPFATCVPKGYPV